MGLRSDLWDLTKTLVKFPFEIAKAIWEGLTEDDDEGSSSFREAARKGYERGLYGADGKPPLPEALNEEPLQQTVDKTIAESRSKNTAVVPDLPAPVVQMQEPSIEDVQEDQETFDPTTLSCEVHEVSVDAVIDYTDKHGNETRREITTEEIYDYEDGVVVIRAFCHSRRDYRTFVSKRIRYWVEPNSGKPVDVGNIGEYLIKVSRRDIPNLAMNLTADANSEISLFKFYIGKFSKCYQTTDTGLIRYNVTPTQASSLAAFIVQNQNFGSGCLREEISQLNQSELEELTNQVLEDIVTKQVGDGKVHLAKNVLASRRYGRRKSFVSFVESLTESLPYGASVSQVMQDELLDPSFRIDFKEFAKQVSANQTLEVKDIKDQSDSAEQELVEVSKTETPRSKTRSKKQRKSAELNAVRNIAKNECQVQLLKNLSEGKMIFERQPFEQEIRRRVCEILSEEDVRKYGDMLLPYLGNGIQFGYLVTGLKKKNRGWYPNEQGVVVIDLNNIEKD